MSPAAQEKSRDLAATNPGNAATRKPAWNVPPPADTAALGGIIGGEELWPALLPYSKSTSASTDSLSLSDASAPTPSAQEDLIMPDSTNPIVSAIPVSTSPISPSPNPTFALAPSNVIPATSLPQNGSANLVGHGGGNGSSEVAGRGGNGINGGHSSSKNSSSADNISTRTDINLNNGILATGRGYNNIRNNGGSANDNGRRIGANGNCPGSGSSSFTSSSEGTSRDGGGNRWSNNSWNGNGNGRNNSFGSRGGRNRRDHERGGSFSARNYPQFSPVPQQLGMYHPGSFHGPLPPPPPPGHFMVQPAFMPYMAPFAYPDDAQAYPFFMVPVDQQFQNMHLVQQQMHSLWVNQDQPDLQQDIRKQIEYYFSTDNLCRDLYLRNHMNEEGWVTIDLLVKFDRMKRFINLGADKNLILDAMRDSETVEVQIFVRAQPMVPRAQEPIQVAAVELDININSSSDEYSSDVRSSEEDDED